MLNINYISYKYSCYIWNLIYIRNKFNNFIKWKKFLKFLIIISKNNFLINFININKIKCFKEIYNLISSNIKINLYMKSFLKNILYENMLKNINLIYHKFIENYIKNKKIINVIIYSANNINLYNMNLIKKIILSKFYNKKIYFFLKKDKNIIAGFKIYINDLIIDASLIKEIKKINFYLKY